jgi:hypothetical protein
LKFTRRVELRFVGAEGGERSPNQNISTGER